MTRRAVVIGLVMGGFVAAGTYFNDAVIRQTMLVGNFLPIGIFGVLIVLLLAINPLLGLMLPALQLRPRELALAAAIGLGACAWPGSNLLRTFATIAATPHQHVDTQTAWRAHEVLSYVPGASSRIAPGHVLDWPGFLAALRTAEPGSALATLRERLPAPAQPLLEQPALDPDQRSRLLHRINAVLVQEDLAPGSSEADGETQQQRNRRLIVEGAGGAVAPAPSGEGVILPGRPQTAEAVEHLAVGRAARGKPPGLFDLPDWELWWPTIRLWGGAALLLALCSMAMAVIVHPQWSRHELLAYPLVRLVEQTTETLPGRRLPAIAYNKLFWWGFGTLVVVHAINGLHAWVPLLPHIPLKLRFEPLMQLFPNASRVPGGWGYFAPTMVPTVIAFAFFIARPVSFSLGIAPLALMMFGSVLLSYGVSVDSGYFEAGKGNLLRLGSYLAMVLIIGYIGRRWYGAVLAKALGITTTRDVPPIVAWAARALALGAMGLVAVLSTGGLPVVWSIAFVGLALAMVLVLSRVVAETGMFFLQPAWLPAAVLTALFGFSAIGPTAYIIMGVASIMLVGDPREALMPYLTTALRIADERDPGMRPVRRVLPWLGVMVVVGLLLAGLITLGIQHGTGMNANDRWATRQLPSMPFDALATHAEQLSATGELAANVAMEPMQRLGEVQLELGPWFWMLLGAGLVIGCSFARLHFQWWPIHPVLFLVWGTTPIAHFAASFFVGWAVKSAVIGTAGAKGYATVRPLMVGVICGELLMGMFWMAVGAVYYFTTGLSPTSYTVFPG